MPVTIAQIGLHFKNAERNSTSNSCYIKSLQQRLQQMMTEQYTSKRSQLKIVNEDRANRNAPRYLVGRRRVGDFFFLIFMHLPGLCQLLL